MPLHFRIPPALVAVRWASRAWIEPTVLLQRGVPSKDHHDCVHSRKGHCVNLDGGFINLHAPGLGPRGHETLHQAALSELVLDGVGMIRARFFEELLEVILKRSCLVLTVSRGLYGMISTRATRSLIDATIAVGCGSWRCCLRLFLLALAPSSAP
jgi:hypothetical protein